MVIASENIHCSITRIVPDPPAPSGAGSSPSPTPAPLPSPSPSLKEECPLCIEEIDRTKLLYCSRCDKAACLSCVESYLRDGTYHKCPYCNLPFVHVKKSWAMPALKKVMYEEESVPEPVWGEGRAWGEVGGGEEGSGGGESEIWR